MKVKPKSNDYVYSVLNHTVADRTIANHLLTYQLTRGGGNLEECESESEW